MLVAAQEVLEDKLDGSEEANRLESGVVLRELFDQQGHVDEGRAAARMGVLQKRDSARGRAGPKRWRR